MIVQFSIEDITAAATQWVFDECPGALAKTVADVRSVVYQRWAEWCGKRGYQLTAENRFAGELYSLNLPDGQRITAGRTSKPLADGRRPYVFSGLRLRVGRARCGWWRDHDRVRVGLGSVRVENPYLRAMSGLSGLFRE